MFAVPNTNTSEPKRRPDGVASANKSQKSWWNSRPPNGVNRKGFLCLTFRAVAKLTVFRKTKSGNYIRLFFSIITWSSFPLVTQDIKIFDTAWTTLDMKIFYRTVHRLLTNLKYIRFEPRTWFNHRSIINQLDGLKLTAVNHS